jgi:hypothetical protein
MDLYYNGEYGSVIHPGLPGIPELMGQSGFGFSADLWRLWSVGSVLVPGLPVTGSNYRTATM